MASIYHGAEVKRNILFGIGKNPAYFNRVFVSDV